MQMLISNATCVMRVAKVETVHSGGHVVQKNDVSVVQASLETAANSAAHVPNFQVTTSFMDCIHVGIKKIGISCTSKVIL